METLLQKQCFKCGKYKFLDEFREDSRVRGGFLNKCKKCIKIYDRKRANLPRRIEARKKYANTARGQKKRKEAILRYYASDHGKRKRNEYIKTEVYLRAHNKSNKKYDDNNPIQRIAKTMVNNAVRDNRLKKEPCSICGSTTRIHGHHEDYYKPLDVIWFCPKHHSGLHKEKRKK